MKPNDLPLVCLPLDLCDDDVATLLRFLRDLTESIERHYTGEMKRPQQHWPVQTEVTRSPIPTTRRSDLHGRRRNPRRRLINAYPAEIRWIYAAANMGRYQKFSLPQCGANSRRGE